MDEYNEKTDNLDFKDLIEKGIVLDNEGRVKGEILSKDELKKRSVMGVKYTGDGCAYYDVCISNMQKMIRRGKVKEAIRTYIRIVEMNGQFISNVVNRLCKVIVSEDIGVASNYIVKECYDFLVYYESIKGKDDISEDKEFRDRSIKLITNLCLCKKSRLVDNTVSYYRKCEISDLNIKALLEEDFDTIFEIFKKVDDFKIGVLCLSKLMYKETKNKITFEDNDIKKLLSRKKKSIYHVWNYILVESKKLNNINILTSSSIFDINCNLLHIFDMGGEVILNLVHAYLNIKLYKLIDWNTYKFDVIHNWDDVKKEDIYCDPCAYDKHTFYNKHINKPTSFFFRYGAKLKNKVDNKELLEIEDDIYSKCVDLYKDV